MALLDRIIDTWVILTNKYMLGKKFYYFLKLFEQTLNSLKIDLLVTWKRSVTHGHSKLFTVCHKPFKILIGELGNKFQWSFCFSDWLHMMTAYFVYSQWRVFHTVHIGKFCYFLSKFCRKKFILVVDVFFSVLNLA